MLSRKLFGAAALAAVVMSLSASMPVASGKSPLRFDERNVYTPIQSISYRFGSKAMSGYFLRDGDDPACRVTLMISENSDGDEPSTLTPTRLRLALNPQQTSSLDSPEGAPLDITCGIDATTLTVDASSGYGGRR
jgi:hypothetical protein